MAEQGQIDLLSIFKQVSKSVKQSKESLNQADNYNHDHGDHMVEIFDVITQAMKEKRSADPADQLEYAAQLLRNKSTSGSGQLYANNLEAAAKQVTGKNVNINMILTILQSLMGSQQKSGSGGGDLLGSLLGGLMGGGNTTSSSGSGMEDILGSLLGQTGSTSSSSNQGIDLGGLVGAGMNAMTKKQEGTSSGLDALTGALLSGSKMSESDYRQQSGELVTKAVLGALSSMLQK